MTMKKTLTMLVAAVAMTMTQAATAGNVAGEKLDSGLGSMVYGESLDSGLGSMVYGESLDSGLGQLTALDLQQYMTREPIQASEQVAGEKQDSGLGTMVYGESLDDGLGSMVYGESLDSGLGELTALDLAPYLNAGPIPTASLARLPLRNNVSSAATSSSGFSSGIKWPHCKARPRTFVATSRQSFRQSNSASITPWRPHSASTGMRSFFRTSCLSCTRSM